MVTYHKCSAQTEDGKVHKVSESQFKPFDFDNTQVQVYQGEYFLRLDG